MFNEDPARTHVTAGRDMIVALYESTNQPLVQVPGKSAQAAQAAIVASRLGRGYEIVIALTFLESTQNVLYTPDQLVDDAGLPEMMRLVTRARSCWEASTPPASRCRDCFR